MNWIKHTILAVVLLLGTNAFALNPNNENSNNNTEMQDKKEVSFIDICLSETSKNPYEILDKLMSQPSCRMHGPEHHVLVGAALLTAYKNAGGEINLKEALATMVERGGEVPGGACGKWGVCGAAVSAGIFMSIITDNSPFATQAWALSNQMTAQALADISKYGGPRCCKRDSFLAVLSAIDFVRLHLGIEMESPKNTTCTRSEQNQQCIGKQCPFNEINQSNSNRNMKSFGSKPWMVPQPVLIIGTYNEKQEANAMNAAWGGTWDAGEIMISMGSHATTENLKLNNGEFTVAFATSETMVASDFVGIVSAKNDPKKMEKTGWTVEKAPNINAPLFKEFPMVMECRIKEKIGEKGNSGYYLIAEVVNVLCDERYLNEQGNPDIEKMSIITFDPCNMKYVELGKTVGNAFSDGKKLK